MTTIQVLTFDEEDVCGLKGRNVIVSSMHEFRSMDEFDYNVIDISSESFWNFWISNNVFFTDSVAFEVLNDAKTFSQKTRFILVLPQNISISTDDGHHTIKSLRDVIQNIASALCYGSIEIKLVAEKTTTTIHGLKYNADFSIGHFEPQNKSDISEKTTSCLIYNTLITTLDIFESIDHFSNFFSQGDDDRETPPDWFEEIKRFDDNECQNIIEESEKTITELNAKIFDRKKKLIENNRFKTILYTNGNELVEVVHDILEELLMCDLSEFEDKNREDFLIKENNVTFVGEIKGISDNVKNNHVSQLVNHCDNYKDGLGIGNDENVKGLLIINPQRGKNPKDRKPVGNEQIIKAERDNCLIITTETLLELFESYRLNNLQESCLKMFNERRGLFRIE